MPTIDVQVHAYERNHPGRFGLLKPAYEQGVEAFRVTNRLSESDRATLTGGTLQRVYRWSPSTT